MQKNGVREWKTIGLPDAPPVAETTYVEPALAGYGGVDVNEIDCERVDRRNRCSGGAPSIRSGHGQCQSVDARRRVYVARVRPGSLLAVSEVPSVRQRFGNQWRHRDQCGQCAATCAIPAAADIETASDIGACCEVKRSEGTWPVCPSSCR